MVKIAVGASAFLVSATCEFLRLQLSVHPGPQLDADEDGQLSLREIEAIRLEFAAKAGWWIRPEAP